MSSFLDQEQVSIGPGTSVTVTNFPAIQPVSIDQTGTNNDVKVIASVLPTGASTEATLAALNTKVTTTANGIKVDGSAATQPISGSVTVTQATGTNLHAVIDSGSITITPSGTQNENLTQVGGSAISLGQKTMANSLPIVIASDQSAVPISGTVTANAGTGTFTVGQATGSNLHAVLDTGSTTAVTQATAANLNATVVGSGNFTVVQATAANLNATVVGTVTANAGTNLNTSALALDTSVNAISLAQNATTSGQKGILHMGAVTTAAPAYTTAQTSPLSLTTAGALRTDSSGTTQPVSGTVTANQGTANATPWNTNISQYGGTATTLGQKVMASSIPVVIASDQSTVVTIQNDGTKLSYSAAVTGVASAAAATDIFLISGSGTKTIRVKRIGLSATQTTAGEINAIVLKRSTADSAGTAATLVPHDSTNSAATAVVQSFTVNPTAGTLVGNVRSVKFFAPAAASTSAPSITDFSFGDTFSQAIVLRGTAQQLCINLNGATVAGGSFSFYVEWTEE